MRRSQKEYWTIKITVSKNTPSWVKRTYGFFFSGPGQFLIYLLTLTSYGHAPLFATPFNFLIGAYLITSTLHIYLPSFRLDIDKWLGLGPGSFYVIGAFLTVVFLTNLGVLLKLFFSYLGGNNVSLAANRELHRRHGFWKGVFLFRGLMAIHLFFVVRANAYPEELAKYGGFVTQYVQDPLLAWVNLGLGLAQLLALWVWNELLGYEEEVRVLAPTAEAVYRTDGGDFVPLPQIKEKGKGNKGKKWDPNGPIQEGEKEEIIRQMREKLVLPESAEERITNLILTLRHYKYYKREYGNKFPKGVILKGPPGTGKTSIAQFLAEQAEFAFIPVTPADTRIKWVGDSAKAIRGIFELARENAPSVIFIDEADAVAPKRENARTNDEAVHALNELLSQMDGLAGDKDSEGPVVVIAATNHPENLDAAFQSRLSYVLDIPKPDIESLKKLLRIKLKEMRVDLGKVGDREIEELATLAEGLTGRDLEQAASIAKEKAITERKEKDLQTLMEFFKEAISDIRRHSGKSWRFRKESSLPPDIYFQKPTQEEFRALLNDLRKELVLPPSVEQEVIQLIQVVRHYGAYRAEKMGKIPRLVLLVGPPGTGKTSIAQFIANKSGFSFISPGPEELRSMWVGQSVKMQAELFEDVKRSAPSVLFIDEIEGLFPKRGMINDTETLLSVTQFLHQIEGLNDEEGPPVVTIGATNNLDMLDPALISRAAKRIYVPPPTGKLLRVLLDFYLGSFVRSPEELDLLVREAEGLSPRDIEKVRDDLSMRFFMGKEVKFQDIVEVLRQRKGGGT